MRRPRSRVGAAVPLTSTGGATERQVTDVPHGHVLTNGNVCPPDSRWIVDAVGGPGGSHAQIYVAAAPW